MCRTRRQNRENTVEPFLFSPQTETINFSAEVLLMKNTNTARLIKSAFMEAVKDTAET